MADSFCTSVVGDLVAKLSAYLLAPIGRQFGYVLCYKSYIEDLKNEVKELESARERVQRSVVEARYDGKPIYTDIQDWLVSATEEAEEARNLLERGKRGKSACLRGWIPNPLVRHPIGREVRDTTKVIQRLHGKSRDIKFEKVYHQNTPTAIVPATTSAARTVDKKADALESRALITEDIMKALADPKVHTIGVYGLGGVGKSKLLGDVETRVREEELFGEVPMAVVSRDPDLKRVQAEIADALGLRLKNVETVRGRADRLRGRLKPDPKKNILIILDNLWEKLELKDVGIPCGDDNKVKGCKLLLTSRYRNVLLDEMDCDRYFQLKPLEHGEARRLFEITVGNKVTDPEFETWVDGVVKNCGGLPLSIVQLAKRLKHRDLAAWRSASTNRDLSNVKSLVELSYEDLKDQRIKSVFLVCAIDAGRIWLNNALVYCMGLGLYENFSETMKSARDRLEMDLRSLEDSSLVLDSDDKVWFRMHDIVVDVAISIAVEEWKALVGTKRDAFEKWSEDDLRKCRAISFRRVGIDKLPEKLDCPNLEILLLTEHNAYLKIPQSFFESMEKLQVLDITGLSFTSLPSSIELLKNLKSLNLDQCHLEDVAVLGKLKGLQFLSFIYSAIPRLPKEIGELTELRFLDLRGCTRLKVIEPGVLGSLINLEELYMEDSFDQWEAEDEAPRSNASLAELKNMKNLSTLSIAIPHSANLPRDLPFGRLDNYKIQIGDTWDWSGKDKEPKTLKLKLDLGNLHREEWVLECFLKTQDLHLDGLQDDIDSVDDLCVEGFPELKHLHLQNSPSFRYVVHSTETIQCVVFARLESLFLETLNNLEKICRGYVALESFSKLKIVKVDNCGEIRHLFHLPMKRIIPRVEEIEISKCCLMQQIIADAEANEDGDEIDDDTEAKSCNLHRLTLRNLPEMTSFRKTANHSVDFFDGQQLIKLHKLEAIIIERCQLIRGIFDMEGLTASGDVKILSKLRELTLSYLPSLGHIWNKNPRRTPCFQNLRALKVQNCENLRFLFSSSMAKALGQIKEIEIASCKLMEEIIAVQEEESQEATTTDTLEFPSLTSLSLKELPNLRTFSYGKCIHCTSLTRLMISGCARMIEFSSCEGKQHSITVDTGLQQVFGHINSVFFNEKVHFPNLGELTLSSMCELKRIWPNQLHGQSFFKLESLTVRHCENLLHVFPSNSVDRWQSLSEIEVVECPSLEILFEPTSLSAEERQKRLSLNAMEKLKLLNLPRLRDILKSDCKVSLAFPCLKEVNVRDCPSLPYLFSSATAATLARLEALDVSCCGNLRAVIATEEGEGNTVETLKFRHLSTLKLGNLEKLISFHSMSCSGDGLHPLFDEKVEFLDIKSMEISHMDNLEKIWFDELSSKAFSKLKMLTVEYCPKLSSIFSSSIILIRFRSLEKLTVTDCGSLEVVFHIQELNTSGARSTGTFPLRELNLERLPKMKHVWCGNPRGTLTFGCLQCLKVTNCEALKSLFHSLVAKDIIQLEKLEVQNCGVEEIIGEEDGGEGRSAGDLFFPRLTEFILYDLPKLGSFYINSHTSTWPSLKELLVKHCGKMKSITFAGEIQSCQDSTISENQPALFSFEKVFPRLEILRLAREDVEMMPEHYMFGNLRHLLLECYHEEKVAFPSNFLLHRFPLLETLTVDCSSFEEIFSEDASGHGGTTPCGLPTDMQKLLDALGNLKKLWLVDLQYLRQVWKDGSLMVEILKQIQYLYIHDCPVISTLLPSKTSFQRLKKLQVVNCAGLVHMGTCSAVTSLVHLTCLLLVSCDAMKDAVTDDGNGVEEISFPKLQLLALDGLPSLESFSPTNCAFMFPSLVHIIVNKCPKMNIFCQGALSAPQLDKVLLSYEDDEGPWEGDLNTTIQVLSS